MGKKYIMNYSLERATIDYDSIELEETKNKLEKFKIAFEAGKYEEADKELPPMSFEFNAENMDSDYSAWLENPYINIELNQSDDNILPGAVFEDGLCKIVVNIMFEIELKNGVKPEKFQEWIDENGGWQACSILGDWLYSDDQGGDLYILGVKRKRQ